MPMPMFAMLPISVKTQIANKFYFQDLLSLKVESHLKNYQKLCFLMNLLHMYSYEALNFLKKDFWRHFEFQVILQDPVDLTLDCILIFFFAQAL